MDLCRKRSRLGDQHCLWHQSDLGTSAVVYICVHSMAARVALKKTSWTNLSLFACVENLKMRSGVEHSFGIGQLFSVSFHALQALAYLV